VPRAGSSGRWRTQQPDRAAVGAALVPVAGSAGAPLAAPLQAGVDRAEAGGGEGNEQAGMRPDRGGDSLAAFQAGSHQLVGVGPVGGGARRAARLAPVAAGREQHGVGLVGGVVDLADLAGRSVDVHGAAGQADRVGAVAGGGELLLPAAKLRPGGSGHQVLGDQPERRRHPRHLLALLAEARDGRPGAGSAGPGRRPGSGRCGRPHSGPSSRQSPGVDGRSGTVASRSRPPPVWGGARPHERTRPVLWLVSAVSRGSRAADRAVAEAVPLGPGLRW
jgi:hypothetical protein